MSDKFFFKGRQISRQNHVNHNFQNKASLKLGSKKSPMTLVVTSEARKQEVETLVAEAKLYANINVDSSEAAVESITELTTLLNKVATFRQEKTPKPNESCLCGSGKKYKKCCGGVIQGASS